MSAKFKPPLFAGTLLLAFLTIFVARPAHALTDACATTDPNTGVQMDGSDTGGNPVDYETNGRGQTYPSGGDDPAGASGLTTPIGGWGNGSTAGAAQKLYQTSLQNQASNRINAEHLYISNSRSISATVDYCMSQIDNVLTLISSSGLSVTAMAINLVLNTIVNQFISQLCQMVIQTMTTALQASLSLINGLLCLPLPKLQMPTFHFSIGSQACSGLSLAHVAMVPGTTNNLPPDQLLWSLWKGTLNINNVQQ